MQNDILCPHCYTWRCHPDDRFCGHCGDNLLQVKTVVEPATIYQGSQVPSQITTLIRNVRGGLGGTSFFWRNATGTQVPIVNLAQNDFNQPGEEVSYPTNSTDLALQGNAPVKWSLIHKVAPTKEYPRSTLSCGVAVPVFVLEKSDFLVQDSETIRLTLLHKEGGVALVERIAVSAYEGVALSLPTIEAAFTSSKDDQHTFDFPVSGELLAVLKGRPKGLELTLDVFIKYVPKPLELKLTLRFPIPAKPVLKLPDKVRGLEGRSLRLPIEVENQGGESCQLTSVQVDIRRGRQVILPFSYQPPQAYLLEAGKTHSYILNIPLVDEQQQPIAAKRYQCDVEQMVVEEDLDCSQLKLTTELEVRSSQDYTGIVTIDFGTTATAVAFYPQDNTEQGAISLRLSEKDRFLPTAIAYYLDEQDQLQYDIGHDAIALLDSGKFSDLVYLDNLKWRLDESEPVLLPDGSERTWEDIAVDYLKKIKNIIEEYIVAVVKQVSITHPSRFHPLLMSALNRAYQKAGLAPLSIVMGSEIHNAVAESWPSVTTSLPLRDIKTFRHDTVGDGVFKDGFGKYGVLTYDVGGGSTDMSLFLVEIENFAHMRVTELGTDGTGRGDDRFFGNGFSTLLFKHLWPSCELWLKRKGYDPIQFPITLPWEAVRPGADQVIARENGRRCVAFVLEHLQSDSGAFSQMSVRFRNSQGWDDKEKWAPGEELANLITEFQEECDSSLGQSSLTLQGLSKTEINIPSKGISSEGISLDFGSFIEDFIKTCSNPMFERLQRLSHYPEVSDLEIYVLTSGRGGFFPLVNSMLEAHIMRLRPEKSGQKLMPVRIDPDFAKTIVSQGSCHLARLPKVAPGVIFKPCDLASLGVRGAPDPDTGLSKFIPLCAGIPTPADGWAVAEYPLLGPTTGPREVCLTFYLSADNKEVLSDNDKWLGEVSGMIDIKEDGPAHVMVKAEKENCLDIYIGFKSGDDFESWDKQLLGEYELG